MARVLMNERTQAPVATTLEVAVTRRARRRGLLGRDGLDASAALILAPAAFLAGIFSFLSPCTLPILPAYFAFTFQARRDRVVLMTVAFFLGLATTLVAVGASATALSQVLFRNLTTITFIGGLIVIGFGIISFLGKGFTGAQLLDQPTASVN